MITVQPKNELSSLFFKSVELYPNNIAVRCKEGDVSYRLLRYMVIRLSLNLASNNIRPGSIVAISPANSELLNIVLILSLSLLGCTWIEFKSSLLKSRSIAVDYIITDKEMNDDSSSVRTFRVKDEDWLKGSGHLAKRKNYVFPGYSSAEDHWFVASSSGSTGKPKLIPLTNSVFYERIIRYDEYDHLKNNLILADLFNQTHNIANLHFFSTIYRGGTYVLFKSYTEMVKAGVQYVVASPMNLMHMIKNIPRPATPLIYEARVVGSALSDRFLEQLLQYFDTVRVSYGSTEAGQVSTKALHSFPAEKGVGNLYPGVDLQVVDNDDNVVQDGEEGNIRIKSKGQISAYLNPDKDVVGLLKDGWFYPGDRGYLLQNGELYIAGRAKDQLNIGGVKINAVDVDEAIQQSQGIADGICFVQTNQAGINELMALIVPEKSIRVEKAIYNMHQYIQNNLSHLAGLLKKVYIGQLVPRDVNGKTLRHKANDVINGLRVIELEYERTNSTKRGDSDA